MENIKNAMNAFGKAIDKLGFKDIPVSDTRIWHIMRIVVQVANDKKEFSAGNFNHHRAYLLMLFKKIVRLADMKFNPVKEIEHVGQRETLTSERRIQVNDHIKKNY